MWLQKGGRSLKEVVKTTYVCEICSEEFDTRQKALECEQGGVALPEFKRFEVVEFTGLKGEVEATTVSGFKVKIRNGISVVVQDDANEDWPNPHCLPLGYDVWIYTPGQKIGDRPIFREIVSGVDRKHLKKVHVRRYGRCHLCGCTVLKVNLEPAYSYLGFGFCFSFSKVETQKCSKCGVEFFTTAQSRNVDMLIRQKCRWSIANTSKKAC